MGAVHKLYDDQPEYNLPKRMKIPLQTEVAKYMEEKMNWPSEFCLHYANKFWNYYQAQGWKLSNGNAMKDWKAAFNAQWQTIRFDEDREKLNKLTKKDLKDMDMDTAINYMDGVLVAYKAGMKPDRESAFKMYEYLKSMGVMKLPKETIDHIRVMSGNNMDAAKLHALKYFLDRMVQNNLTFKIYR